MNDYRNIACFMADGKKPIYEFNKKRYDILFNIRKEELGNILIAAKASDLDISIGKAYNKDFEVYEDKYGVYYLTNTSSYIIDDFKEALDFLKFKIRGQETKRIHNNCFILSDEEIQEYFK